MSRKILFYYRSIVLFIYLLSALRFLTVDTSKINHPIVYNFENFPLRYYTTWNLILQCIFLSYALLNSMTQKFKIVSGKDQIQRSNRLQDHLYSATASSTLFVFIFFWLMWQIDRELLYPRGFDLILPTWVNHVIHTLIIVPVIFEFLFSKMNLMSLAMASKLIVTINAIYSVVLFTTYFQHDRWIYNFFGVLNWPLRIIFLVFSVFASNFIYLVLYKAYNFYWKLPSDSKPVSKRQKTK